ncbi:MAG: MFS transporter, partial [Clostridia bacterium]|nr:MFS transporter [Clostridia bacterium]
VLGYALIPALIGAANIRTIAWIFLPLALTMMIPMFMIKEDSTLPADVEKRRTEAQAKGETLEEEETVAIIPSIKYTLKNKPFVLWMLVYCLLEFGLQMYLAGQNVYYSGVLKLSGLQITMLMALTFAPVPFTLLLYNRIVKRRGIRTGYAYSLIVFIIAMLMMAISGTGVFGEGALKMVIVAIASVVSSFGIGCFFSINYTIPATLAAIEKEQTGISHPAMYFAIQGLASGVATAISTGLVWVNLKRIGDGSKVYLMPFIIALAVFLSLVMSKTMPKEIDRIGKETK